MRGEPLRRRLILLAVAAVVPLALASAIALLGLARQQRAQAERAGIEVTRALATAVDAELRRTVTALEAIAIGPALDTGDLKRFHEVMRRVLEGRPNWVTVTLAEPSGQQLANARLPFGAPLPHVVDAPSLRQAVAERRPVIGKLSAGPRGEVAVPIRVPVQRGGEVRYVLTAALKPDSIVDVVNRQRLERDWVVSVFDAGNLRVARSRQHAEFLGKAPAPSLQKLMEGGEEGSGMTYVLEGEEVYTAYSRSRESGWSVAIGVPRGVVEAGGLRSLVVYGGGALLSIALSIVAALAVGRGISRPMAALRAAAQALGRRAAVDPPATPILEIRDVGSALAGAAAERASHEAEREQILRREQEARAAAESANRAKDEFLAMLGHELRNPLGAIANASRLLEDGRSNPESAALARGVIRRQVDHLRRLTDDLLDAGRAVMGKMLLERKPLELSALVARALDTLAATGRLGAHHVRRDLAPAWVQGDYTRIEQIVVNLVGNAVKFTPSGGTISVRVGQKGRGALLSVTDTGVGMPRELCERAFDLFVQGDNGLERSQGGLGIGLTLVRRIAELHEGYASARSPGPGQGSEVVVWLPAIAAPAPAAAPPPSAEAARPRDILIVEDNADAADTLRRLLELAGHRVRVARDGVAGLEILQTAPPEIALIDVGLPRMNGYELARRVRDAAEGSKPPFMVALTGYGAPEDRERALAAGFDEHLVKPVDAEALNALLAR